MKRFLGIVIILMLLSSIGGLYLMTRSPESDAPAKPQEISRTSAPPPAISQEIKIIQDAILSFMSLEPGQFSSLAWQSLSEALSAQPQAAAQVIRILQANSDLNQRLLGLYLELEQIGFSKDLAAYAQRQESISFAATISQWLYLNQNFQNYTEFSADFLQSISAQQQAELFTYLGDIDGERKLPASFGLVDLGRIDQSQLQRLVRQSTATQAALRTHLLNNDVSTHPRNVGLSLLKESQSAELEPTIEYFLQQYTAESRTSLYLLHLRDRAPGINQSVLLSHEQTIKTDGLATSEGTRSAEIILKAIEARPELKIESAVLDEIESYLQNQNVQTGKSQEKLALVGYNRWLNRSE